MEATGWDAAAALAKAISYATTLSSAGAILLLAYGDRLLRHAQRRAILRNVAVLAALAVIASVTRISLLTASMSDDASGLWDRSLAGMILGAGEGWAIALRAFGLALCLSAFRSGRLWGTIACVGAMLAAASFAAVGHVHALTADRLATAVLLLHLLSAAFWLGALWPLLRVAGDGDTAQTAALAARFGKIALYVVGALILAGVFLASQLLGSVAALWNSDYGRMLALKLVLVAALLSAAAVNKLKLTPQLRAGDRAAAATLRRSIGVEMLLGGLILLVTAAFTSLMGPPA